MPSKIIDTHIHIWDFDKADYAWLKGDTSILNKTYSLHELEAERLEVPVTEGILVQAANNVEDTDWMLQNAESNDWIKGVVGWLPLQNPNETYKALSTKYLSNPYFKGVRHLIHDEPDSKWLLQPEVLESLKILAAHHIPYDVVGILPEHIETALQVAELIPDLKMVFDHLNRPPVKTKELFGKWGALMKEAAQHENFFIKISGLGTIADHQISWQGNGLMPYVEYALHLFGENRSFCGGDWPVCLLAGSYVRTWTAYKNIIQQLVTEEAKEKIFYQNAKNFYKL